MYLKQIIVKYWMSSSQSLFARAFDKKHTLGYKYIQCRNMNGLSEPLHNQWLNPVAKYDKFKRPVKA